MNKKIAAVIMISALALPSLTSCGSADLVFFNWGEYIDPEVVKKFESANSVKIDQRFYDSNELMIEKLSSSSYDVLVPSDYAIEELAEDDKIIPLDQTKFTNYNSSKLVPEFKARLDDLATDKGTDKGFDLLKYAIPYTWGEVGLVYDSSVISEDEIKTEGWEAIRTAKNKDGSSRRAAVYDSARDIYSMALSACGHDFVNPSAAEISDATAWLKGMKTVLGDDLRFKTEELLDELPQHKYDIAIDYSGDAAYAIRNEEGDRHDLKYYVPDPVVINNVTADVRTNIYTDSICITKTCKNTDLAYKFIDYLCSTEAATADTEYIGYTTPIDEVYQTETADDGTFYDAGSAYKLTPVAQDHFYRYNAALKSELEDLWSKNIK